MGIQKDWGANEGMSVLTFQVNQAIASALKTVLEDKHIYQKVPIDIKSILSGIKPKIAKTSLAAFNTRFLDLPQLFDLPGSEQPMSELVSRMQSPLPLSCKPENVKLYCEKCERREAFRPLWYIDGTAALRRTKGIADSIYQLFLLVYQCQSCKGRPEAFFVRREGWNLFLHGRSPMESIEVPAHIPKAERQWFRDALVALHGGKILAALFYLRVFIEQFARRVTNMDGRQTGVEIMSAYNDTIPLKQREFMPSLKEWYEKLSESLHAAKEDHDLFENAIKEIERHFDFRRVFGIPEITEPSERAVEERGAGNQKAMSTKTT
jgi:hypothetical protein